MNKEIHDINHVLEAIGGKISLIYEDSLEEIRNRKQYMIDAQVRHQREYDRRGEITSFANRW